MHEFLVTLGCLTRTSRLHIPLSTKPDWVTMCTDYFAVSNATRYAFRQACVARLALLPFGVWELNSQLPLRLDKSCSLAAVVSEWGVRGLFSPGMVDPIRTGMWGSGRGSGSLVPALSTWWVWWTQKRRLSCRWLLRGTLVLFPYPLSILGLVLMWDQDLLVLRQVQHSSIHSNCVCVSPIWLFWAP